MTHRLIPSSEHRRRDAADDLLTLWVLLARGEISGRQAARELQQVAERLRDQ